MTRFSWSASFAGGLGVWLSVVGFHGGCVSDESRFAPVTNEGATGNVGAGGKPAGSGGANEGAFAGTVTSGGATGGKPSSSGGTAAEGGEPSAAGQSSSGGTRSAVDKCQETSDCAQVEGSCFVCEAVGVVKDCVDRGPPVCDNGQLDPCEVCEITEERPCSELGAPGEFSGGVAPCKATCDGWDTSECSVCGNGEQEAGEACDGTSPPAPHTCADEEIAENAGKALPCTDECAYDTTLCGGCSKDAGQCLDGTDCSAPGCDETECKLGTTCKIDCSGGGSTCDDVRCNHDATCNIVCKGAAHCSNVVCDSGATCNLDCSGGGSSCDGTECKPGARCSFLCDTSGSCRDIRCAPGADCDFSCRGGKSVCSGEATCGAGKTCDFDCSTSGDCSALRVNCQKDSICTFKCAGGGSVCPEVTCDAGSQCSFDCKDGDCNAPACENDEVCSGI
jgi:hypothetical protein